MSLQFHRVALVGKYQDSASSAVPDSTREIIAEIAGFLTAQGCQVVLAERTAQLPHISWSPVKSRVGKSTAEAMQLGAQWGYRGIVREILAELKLSPALRRAKICATGGYAARVLKGIDPQPEINSGLTLFGVGCIYQLNR